jgi:hypothetical protein
VIDGAKQFITNAGTEIAACVSITARTASEAVTSAGRDLQPDRAQWRAGLYR